MEKHTFGYEKDYLKGFDSSKCFGYLEEAEMDYKEYIGAFIEDYIYNEKDIKKNDNLLDKLYENALIKFDIPYNTIQLDRWTLFNAYCATQKDSAFVKDIADRYKAKYFVTETKNL